MKLFQAVAMAGMLATSFAVPVNMLAASSNSILSVHVPFAFVAAGEEFSAGDYRVLENSNGIICLQGGGKTVMTLSSPTSGKLQASPGLQFASKDARAHLVAIQNGDELRSIPLGEEPERKLTLGTR